MGQYLYLSLVVLHRIHFCCCCCLNTGWARPFKLLIIHVIISNTHSVVNCCTFCCFWYLLGEGVSRLTKDIVVETFFKYQHCANWFCSKCVFFSRFFLPPSLSFISSPYPMFHFYLVCDDKTWLSNKLLQIFQCTTDIVILTE